MATFQAVSAVAEAVTALFQQSWVPGLLGGLEPQFEVYQGKDFNTAMATGISVFVYQVTVDQVQRTLPPAKKDHRRPLPLRMAFLLTAWGQDASTEHALLGWGMRAIADNPVLSSGFLNFATPGAFDADETVDLSPIELSNDEIFQLWQVLPTSLQLSAAYAARVLRVESELVLPTGKPVVERDLDLVQA